MNTAMNTEDTSHQYQQIYRALNVMSVSYIYHYNFPKYPLSVFYSVMHQLQHELVIDRM